MADPSIDQQAQEQLKLQQQLALLEGIAKKKMTREAISRYGALKLTHPDIALKAIVILAQAVEQGMQETLDDEKFKQLLKGMRK